MRQRRKWKPKGGYNDYRHILWEVVRFKWGLVMMPNICRHIIKNKHEFSRGQVKRLKKTIATYA
jgi:hypothetical protein